MAEGEPAGEDKERASPPGSGDKNNPRRQFLKLSLAAGLALAVGGIVTTARSLFSPLSPEPTPPGPGATTVTKTVTGGSGSSTTTESSTSGPASPFPRLRAANVSDLSGGKTVTFNYPLENTPNLLAKVGEKVEGGVGPDGDIVAYSQLCQHLGCVWGYVPSGGSPKCDSSYKAAGPVGYCCCHGSVYDLANAGKVVEGPSPRPQPQVTLEFDASSGDIFAVGMGPPTIFGHDTGSNDVLNDLQGGTVVS